MEASKTTASKTAAIVFGILAGFGGLIHGIGEVLQGNVATPGLWIESWAQGPIYENMGGEPGITVLPTVNNGGWYLPNGMLLLPPSAFFIIGLIIWAFRTWKPEQVEEREYKIQTVEAH